MEVIILAGGLGTRLSEETELRPKPMVEIGGKPIIWHIMKIYSKYNFNEFLHVSALILTHKTNRLHGEGAASAYDTFFLVILDYCTPSRQRIYTRMWIKMAVFKLDDAGVIFFGK